jgi:hypothetical protein
MMGLRSVERFNRSHTTTREVEMDTRRKAWISRSVRGLTAVFPSPGLRDIFVRGELRKVTAGVSEYTNLDYGYTFIDAGGFGVQLGVQPLGPPKPWCPARNSGVGLYKNPGYDLVNI